LFCYYVYVHYLGKAVPEMTYILCRAGR